MKQILVALAVLFFVACPSWSSEARVIAVRGTADLKPQKSTEWQAARSGSVIKSGHTIKTQARSRATLQFPDGSRVEVYPNTQVNLESVAPKAPTIKVALGRLKAWVSRNTQRTKFEVKTPIAVCSVRGTEFTVSVDENGRTDLDVLKGLVGVSKAGESGAEIPVGAGERLSIRADRPLTPELKSEILGGVQSARREVGLDMTKEQVQAAAASEMRLAEYQEGKTMVDVSGTRVRLEEYIMRPAVDTFKFVVLNEREHRFDYFFYQGKFNKDLPDDLSLALKDLNGQVDTQPEYYLLSYETGRSNTVDKIEEQAWGGHLVNVNGNADPEDDVTSVFDPGTDRFVDVTGRDFYKPLFNYYTYAINNTEKQSWQPRSGIVNALSSLDLQYSYAGEVLVSRLDHPSGEDVLHDRLNLFYGDGTWERWDNYIISDEGAVASSSDFSGITTGTQYKERLLQWNYEQVITASEFGGRKIDLVVEPKIFIKSGMIE